MKTKPSTEYALLGALMTGPKHGYEIMQFLGAALGSTWHIGTSQLYALLRRLEGDNLLGSSLETQDTRPSKRVFSLTPAGEKRFLDWLQAPTEHVRDLRIEFLAKIFFFDRLSLKGGVALISAQTQVLEQIRKRIKQREEKRKRPHSTGWFSDSKWPLSRPGLNGSSNRQSPLLMRFSIMADVYAELKQRALKLFKDQNLLAGRVRIQARGLSVKEAIGNPEADDFPLQKGKERLMQADFCNASGQAFTDRYGDFEGTLDEVLGMGLDNNYRRALFVASLNAVLRHLKQASLNAVLRHLKQVEKTVHCRDEEPALCAAELCRYLKNRYGRVKIAQVGFQPRMVEALAPAFALRLMDLDPDNIGTMRFNTLIEGPEATDEVIRWADLLLVTGTTIVNGTIEQFLGEKPVLFYGTTIAGPAHLMGWERFCACGR